jgi:putative spermidine/putrescine transport system ATP-binding protein
MMTVENLNKRFGDHVAVRDFHLSISQGEFVALLGPSGSGKSTVLRMIAGLLEPSSGEIHIAGTNVTHLPPQKRNLGLVFQSYALFPNMTVFENVAFPLQVRKWAKAKIRERVEEMLDLVGLSHRAKYLPEHLSGGERQRVALARALAFHPPLLLLDEPFSALDAKVRESLRRFLKEIQKSTGVTTLMVTHDQAEALELSDRVVVMNQGQIEQIGTPQDVYYYPQSAFTANFIGHVNTISPRVLHVDPIDNVTAVAKMEWQGCTFDWPVPRSINPDEPREIFVRPESIDIRLDKTELYAPAVVRSATFMGSVTRLIIDANGKELLVDVLSTTGSAGWLGQTVFWRIAPQPLNVRSKQDAAVPAP